MRNLFRRQTKTTAPTLSERAASLRASLRPIPAAPAALPAPGSPEAMTAWHAACHEHSKRSAPLHEYTDLMDPSGGFWTKGSLGRALETGGISVAEYARLHPLASERELRLDQIGHELNTAALFALAYADEYPQKPEAQNEAESPADLTAAILDGWAAWGTVQDNPDDGIQAEADANRRNLINAAMVLPATPESIKAKALACAWMEWVNTERCGRRRAGLTLMGREEAAERQRVKPRAMPQRQSVNIQRRKQTWRFRHIVSECFKRPRNHIERKLCRSDGGHIGTSPSEARRSPPKDVGRTRSGRIRANRTVRVWVSMLWGQR